MFSTLIALVLLLSLAGISWRMPPAATAFVLSMFVAEQALRATVPAFADNRQLYNFVAAGLLLVAGASVLRRQGFRVHAAEYFRCGIPIFLLLFFTYSTSLWSIDPLVTDSYLLQYLPYVLLVVVLAPLLLRDPSDVQVMLKALLLSGSLSLLILASLGAWSYRGVFPLGHEREPMPPLKIYFIH